MFRIGKEQEQSLSERLRRGENGAMRAFYSLYGEHLAGICARYIADEEDMKDVLQDALVHIITHIGDFEYRGAGSLKAWASRVVVNEAQQHLRTARRLELAQLDQDIADEQEADDPPIHDIPPDAIQQMISQLPTGYRTVFNLYVFEGKSHQEIARMLGIKERSSSSQLRRAKNLLAEMIRKYNDNKSTRQ